MTYLVGMRMTNDLFARNEDDSDDIFARNEDDSDDDDEEDEDDGVDHELLDSDEDELDDEGNAYLESLQVKSGNICMRTIYVCIYIL